MSLANKLSIEDVDLKGKRVLIRVGFSTVHVLELAIGVPMHGTVVSQAPMAAWKRSGLPSLPDKAPGSLPSAAAADRLYL